MNNTFNQLMVCEQTENLTVEQQTFVETHKQIISCGNLAARGLIEMSRKLKEMRDGKYYQAAGFSDFGEYVEEACGIKERHAYNYIRVVETYDAKYLEANAGLGITKLTLLASVSEEEREEIAERIDLEEANVHEVNAAVKDALRERDEAKRQLDIFSAQLTEARTEAEQADSARLEMQTAYDEKKKELIAVKDTVKKLESEKKDLEEKLKTAKKEVKTVPDVASAEEAKEQKKRADELEKKLNETTAQLAVAKEQKKTIASDDLLVFKVKFNDLQRLGEDIKKSLAGMSEENAIKCKNAVNAVLNSWKETMGL